MNAETEERALLVRTTSPDLVVAHLEALAKASGVAIDVRPARVRRRGVRRVPIRASRDADLRRIADNVERVGFWFAPWFGPNGTLVALGIVAAVMILLALVAWCLGG